MLFDWGTRTFVMGIVNVTPDSFYPGSRHLKSEDAVKTALRMVAEGADMLDIGGESSRPDAAPVSEKDEIARIIPVIQKIRKESEIPISVDTVKPAVAMAAIEAGANVVNDIRGLRDGEMRRVISEASIPVIVMHMQGTPQTMQANPTYTNAPKEVYEFLEERVKEAEDAGIKEIVVDPGIGFGKTAEHNLELLRNLKELRKLKKPVLVGVSRKSFLQHILKLGVDERLEGSLGAGAACIMNGVDMLRAHDVKETVRMARVVDAILRR
ncbi:Pterin binding enzyme [Candidatus Gugararchaeum adminiculabundum]|nr:Pterin binding enzyme [Candidatus Gugararchaeum adminiculabundum]